MSTNTDTNNNNTTVVIVVALFLLFCGGAMHGWGGMMGRGGMGTR